MKPIFYVTVLAAFWAVSGQNSLAQDWDNARAAYDRGDFETAFQELLPFAEQGDAEAQFVLGVWSAKDDAGPDNHADAAKNVYPRNIKTTDRNANLRCKLCHLSWLLCEGPAPLFSLGRQYTLYQPPHQIYIFMKLNKTSCA